MTAYFSILSWRILWTEEHGWLQSMWLQRVGDGWERSVFIPIPKNGNAKECSNYHRIALISHASKVMLQILQARLQQYVNCETPIFWPPYVKSWLIEKDPDAGRDWGQEEKGMTEDEMAGWHHWLDGNEFEWTPGVADGQGDLACCDSWGHKK